MKSNHRHENEKRLAAMQHRARDLVWQNSVWCTESDISTERGKAISYTERQLRHWKSQRKIFGLTINDRAIYPYYAFDSKNRFLPQPALGML
jgi:PAB1-binding protein PBP1